MVVLLWETVSSISLFPSSVILVKLILIIVQFVVNMVFSIYALLLIMFINNHGQIRLCFVIIEFRKFRICSCEVKL